LLAHISGLPVQHFIAACNANDIVPQFLQSGDYQPKKAVATLSNAMDVGDPSNFVRVLELFHHQLGDLRKTLSSYSISDDQTKKTINDVYTKYKYLPDPHGAVGYLALQQYLHQHSGQKGIFLETAHPVKFYDVVEPVIGEKVPIPPAIEGILELPKKSLKINPDYEALKAVLEAGVN
jgi:threonine synthase